RRSASRPRMGCASHTDVIRFPQAEGAYCRQPECRQRIDWSPCMRKFFTAAMTAFAFGAAALPPVAAQERPSTILVLDASGSMWGQIDGVNKITIAREV